MASKRTDYPYCLDPGRLRQRVTIERSVADTDGDPNPEYTPFIVDVPAEVIETGGGEYVRGRQIEAGIAALVTIRHRSDVTPQMRLRYGTRYLNIESVTDRSGYRVELTLTCREVQP